MLRRVVCATDRSALASKVYRHAAGLAAATGASLALVHVSAGGTGAGDVQGEYLNSIPYTGSVDLEPQIFVCHGDPVDAVLQQARDYDADVIVCGSRRRGTVASWLLGSTSRALLEKTRIPLLVIPDNDFDVISAGDNAAALHFGSVIAALDRAEFNQRQLTLASALADVAGQPLHLLTVIEPGDATTPEQAHQYLRERAHGLTPVRPHSLIVRRGDVAHEIVGCCDAEHAGLVVMGLRATRRGSRPGTIATAVLARGRSAVLAICDAPP